MLYVKKIDLENETTEILSIFDKKEEVLAQGLARELQEADDNNEDCRWVFMVDSSEVNQSSYSELRKRVSEQLLEEGEITQANFDFLEAIDHNVFMSDEETTAYLQNKFNNKYV